MGVLIAQYTNHNYSVYSFLIESLFIMFTINTSTLEEGTIKAVGNARDLVETALTLRSLDTISSKLGYSVLFMQTGLEEAAKASFLFEKYLRSLRKGRVAISEKEWKLWMGGRRSHSKRVARVQYLYALSEEVSSMPGASIIFPQGVKDMLQNRNAALYVDFDPNKQEFKSPSEVVDSSYLTANYSFAKHILNFTSYDKAIGLIKSVILNKPSNTDWFVKSIEGEINRKQIEVSQQIEEYKKQTSTKLDNFNREIDRVFCVGLRQDNGCQIIYSCVAGTTDDSIFLVDKQTNHFAIQADGKVIHARFAKTVETSLGYRHDWDVIGSC